MAEKVPPRVEYLRNKFIRYGIRSLSPKDCIELLLEFCTDVSGAYHIMDGLFNKFATVEDILSADYKELVKVDGVDEDTAIVLGSMRSYCEIIEREGLTPEIIGTPRIACRFFGKIFPGGQNERVRVLLLDSGYVTCRCTDIAEGTSYGVGVDRRRLTELLERHWCTKCIISHTHPGGQKLPSLPDKKGTRALYEYLKNIGVELVDHIIVGEDGEYSFAGEKYSDYDKLYKDMK